MIARWYKWALYDRDPVGRRLLPRKADARDFLALVYF